MAGATSQSVQLADMAADPTIAAAASEGTSAATGTTSALGDLGGLGGTLSAELAAGETGTAVAAGETGTAVAAGEGSAIAAGEATGLALDATGVGSIVGIAVGIGSLLVGIFSGSIFHHDPAPPPPPVERLGVSYQAGEI